VIGECGGGRSTGREGKGGSGGGGGQAGRTEWCGGYIGRRTAGAVGEAGPARRSVARAFGGLRLRLTWCACAKCLAGGSGSTTTATRTGHGPHTLAT
jgi:hypothetical protein